MSVDHCSITSSTKLHGYTAINFQVKNYETVEIAKRKKKSLNELVCSHHFHTRCIIEQHICPYVYKADTSLSEML